MPRLPFNTVKAKLTALVALSATVTLISLPVLSWIMNRQLIDEVDDRVPEAMHGFNLELMDDLRDLEAAGRTLDESEEVERALRDHKVQDMRDEARIFHDAYPDFDFLTFTSDAKLLADVGLKAPVSFRHDLIQLNGVEQNGETRALMPHGCEHPEVHAPVAYSIARSVKDAGSVVVCLPIDRSYLMNAARKLGVQLAVLPLEGQPPETTPGFPLDKLALAGDTPSLTSEGSEMWALTRFKPIPFASDPADLRVVIALNVTDIRNIVRQNLAIAVGVLLLAALVSVIMGARLASVMSRALGRVSVALKKMEQDEYVHVEAIKTGDELEDLASGFNTMVDGLKERDKLRTTFGKYMTQTVMDHLLAGKVTLGGETLTVTILFSDIRSFTSISENMSAQALVALLNEYFTEMVTIVMQEDGVVDKYIGDAIMAVFGAPVPKPDDAVRAVRAAVRMREALANLNERLVARGLEPLKTGIGIHTGEVVAGNIGSEARMEYTVIGDAVNLASRLESNTKDLGVSILISEDTQRLVEGTCTTRQIKEISVKGRAQPVMTYEVIP